MKRMSDYTKWKAVLILAVSVAFTLVNAIKGNGAMGYIMSLVIFPLFTWWVIEVMEHLKIIGES